MVWRIRHDISPGWCRQNDDTLLDERILSRVGVRRHRWMAVSYASENGFDNVNIAERANITNTTGGSYVERIV